MDARDLIIRHIRNDETLLPEERLMAKAEYSRYLSHLHSDPLMQPTAHAIERMRLGTAMPEDQAIGERAIVDLGRSIPSAGGIPGNNPLG